MRLANCVQQRFNNIDVMPFVAGAHVIDRTRSSLFQGEEDRPTVIVNVNPISYIAAVAVYRDRFIVERVRERQRQKLFRKLPGTIIIAAARYYRVEAESVTRGTDEMLRGGFRSSIRTVWGKRRIFREEGIFVFRQTAHYLIRGDLNETLDASRPGGVKQHLGSQNIRAQKRCSACDAAV